MFCFMALNVGLWFLSAHMEHDLCPPPLQIPNVLTFIHSANHVMSETRQNSKINTPNLQGQTLEVTFQGTL